MKASCNWLTAAPCVAVVAALASGAGHASRRRSADDYPNQPIKLMVPWPPGGGVDTTARHDLEAARASGSASRSSSTTAAAPAATSAPSSPPARSPTATTC